LWKNIDQSTTDSDVDKGISAAILQVKKDQQGDAALWLPS
jgi:hypothetical protein